MYERIINLIGEDNFNKIKNTKVCSVLSYLGRYSIDIYIFSWFFQVASMLLITKILKINNYTIFFISNIIIGSLCLPFSIYILRKFKIFKFLSDEDALSVLYFVHSTACSESFTADYIAKNTGIEEARAAEILNEFCAVGACHWVTAHLTEGEIRIYECRGDGILLSLIAIAFEIMCGRQAYDYHFNGRCKMIGGK